MQSEEKDVTAVVSLKPERVQDGLVEERNQERNQRNTNQKRKGETIMSTNQNQSQSPSPAPAPQPKQKNRGNAFADLLVDWESLLGAVANRGNELARVEPYRAALADTLAKVKETKNLQVSHRATKQRSTQQLKAMLLEAKDLAARLRGAIRAEMGTGNEQLVQFGIHPIRRRVTRSQQSATEPPPPQQPELQGKRSEVP